MHIIYDHDYSTGADIQNRIKNEIDIAHGENKKILEIQLSNHNFNKFRSHLINLYGGYSTETNEAIKSNQIKYNNILITNSGI